MNTQALLIVEDNHADFATFVRGLGKFASTPDYTAPSLIILDLNLVGFDEFDILAELKKNEVYKRIPVVILSNSSNEKDVEKSYDRGTSAYIQKPMSPINFQGFISAFKYYWFNLNILPHPLTN